MNTDNIINATLPLGPKEFKALMQDKDIVFKIDLVNSSLQTNKANLAFLANANIPAIIDFDVEGLTKEFVMDLIKEWMIAQTILDVKPLKEIVSAICVYAIGNDYTVFDLPSMIDEEFIITFIKENNELVGEYLIFLDSCYFVFHAIFKELDEESVKDYKYEGNLDIVEGRDAIGKNVVLLFTTENFSIAYLVNAYRGSEVSRTPLYYFKSQFEEYIFRNTHLSSYFNHPFNVGPRMLEEVMKIFEEQIDIDKILSAIEDTGDDDGQLPSE